jgi:hypothetical protein
MSATESIEDVLSGTVTLMDSLDQFEACKEAVPALRGALTGVRELVSALRYVADFDGMALSQDQYAAVAKRAKRALTTNGLSL